MCITFTRDIYHSAAVSNILYITNVQGVSKKLSLVDKKIQKFEKCIGGNNC